MDSSNSAKEDLRSISEQEAARQQEAQQAEQVAQQQTDMARLMDEQQAQARQQVLIDEAGLPPIGSRVTVSVPGIDIIEPIGGVIEAVEADDEGGGYVVTVLTDDGERRQLSAPWKIEPEPEKVDPVIVGDGTRENPLRTNDAAALDAAAQQNTHRNSTVPKSVAQKSNASQPRQTKEGLVSHYFLPVIFIAILGSCAYFSWHEFFDGDRPESVSTGQTVDAQQAAEARRQRLKNSVTEMASKVNAVTNWAANLADGRAWQSSVLTAELHKQWVISRPVLLLGNIQDIAINSDATYQVVVAHNSFRTKGTIFFPGIRMNLRCPESVAVPLIQAAKKDTDLMGASTAITAVIESIVTTRETNTTGEVNTVMTGMGKCLDAMYLTEYISWP